MHSMADNRESPSFPTTRWTLVGRAEAGGDELAALLKRYLPALRAYLMLERRLNADVADDLLQGFTASRILEQNLLSRADAARGKFRTFLLTALRNYAADEARAANAAKRRPADGNLASLDEARDVGTSDSCDSFDIEWARQTLADAIERMRKECQNSGRPQLWELLRVRVIEPALTGGQRPPYEQLVARFGFATPMQASNALITAKRMFARALRATIGRYADDDEEIERELDDLRTILARSKGA
jgi:RNA polymerase sigma-70 factor (ECF subfamily)